jgi:hypothetical protein
MPAFLNNISVPQSVMPSTDSLWNRNWVFCPHNDKQSVGPSQDPSINTGVCVGSVPKIEWLDPSKRVEACARELIAEAPSSASVNFCLMNSQTERLCLQMTSWLQRTEFFLCQAAGLCEESDFFYSPTTFNLQEQEFVFDTVQRFYTEDAGLECPTTVTIDTQRETNEAVMEQCSSVSISPLLIVVEQFRAGKRSLVLLTYHCMRVSWRLMEVFLAVTADAAATLADQASNAVQAAAEALLTEVTALMFVLGDFVEQIGTAVMELTMSKGVGSTFKEIIMALCRIVTWIFNNIWARIMCPVVQFLLEFMQMCIDVWQVLVDVLRTLFIPVDLLVNVIEFVRNTLNVIASSLNECAQLPADVCVLAPPVSANTNTRGTLPMPTRCWSSYVTFFGDNQQLSCTAADTCKLGSLSSERIMCGACPSQNNPSIQEYACDYITSICTCAVPQLRESSCLVNEDCMQVDDETSCMLINDDLQISRSSILCSKCNGGLFLGENLQIFFTHSKPTYSCDLGLSPSWYLSGQRSSCPATKGVAWDGSSSVEDCTCLPGYAIQGPGLYTACSPCPAGTYAESFNSSQCTQCPANSGHASIKQTNLSACLCHSGFTGPVDAECIPCAAGTFKPANGSAACSLCPTGTDTYESYPRTACQCHKGFSPSCVVKNGVSRTYSNPGDLPHFLQGSLQDGIGWGWRMGDQCISGGGLCAWMLVDMGVIENVVGVVISNVCDLHTSDVCGRQVSSLQVQYSTDASSGYFQAQSIVDGGVTFYPQNHRPKPYFYFDDKIWLNFTAPVQARYIRFSMVQFSNGWGGIRAGVNIWPSFACAACPVNTFKDYIGSRPNETECKICPYLSSTAASGSTSCSCSPGAYTDINSSDASVCRGCDPGRHFLNGTCHDCLDNTFASESNAQMCTECNNASFVHDHPRSFCLCQNGFTSEIVEVNPPDNMRSFSLEVHDSFSGYAYSISRLDGNWINAVQVAGGGGGFGGWVLHSMSIPAGTWLAMDLGFVRRVYGVVIQSGGSGYGGAYCNQASWWVTAVSVECSFERNTGFVNAKNQANNGDMFYPVDIGDSDDCVASRVGCSEKCSARRSYNIFKEVVMARYIKIRVWNYRGGFAMRAGGLIVSDECRPCPADTYKDYAGLPTAGLTCNTCQSGAVSNPGSVLQSQCKCRAGYFRNGSTSCPSCAPGYYSLTQDVPECTQCPVHTYTDPALHPWNLASDCRVCKLCNTSTNMAFTDHYDAARGGSGCGASNLEVCTQCPSGSSLFIQTTEIQRNFGARSCFCDKDFYGIVGTACTVCPAGKFRPDFINDSTTLADCLCAPGFEPDPAAANLCRQCPIGTYKPEFGHHKCSVCPDTFTTEFTGKSQFSDCVCKSGYALSTEQVCVICPENTYKVGFDMKTTCPSCPSNSFVAAGAVSHLNCTCVPGFEPYNNVCNLCRTGKYKNETVNIGDALAFDTTVNHTIVNQPINLTRACSAGGCPVTSFPFLYYKGNDTWALGTLSKIHTPARALGGAVGA